MSRDQCPNCAPVCPVCGSAVRSWRGYVELDKDRGFGAISGDCPNEWHVVSPSPSGSASENDEGASELVEEIREWFASEGPTAGCDQVDDIIQRIAFEGPSGKRTRDLLYLVRQLRQSRSAQPDATESPWDRELRVMWAMGHGCDHIYGDDGVLQCKHGDWTEGTTEERWFQFLSIQSQRASVAQPSDTGRSTVRCQKCGHTGVPSPTVVLDLESEIRELKAELAEAASRREPSAPSDTGGTSDVRDIPRRDELHAAVEELLSAHEAVRATKWNYSPDVNRWDVAKANYENMLASLFDDIEGADTGGTDAERRLAVLQRACLYVGEDGDVGLSLFVGEPEMGSDGITVAAFPFLTEQECRVLNGEEGLGVLSGADIIGRALDFVYASSGLRRNDSEGQP